MPASRVGLLKTMTSADGGSAELASEERLRPGRFEVVEDEPAGADRTPGTRGASGIAASRTSAHAPTTQPRPTRDEAAEAIEGGHGTSRIRTDRRAAVIVGLTAAIW